MNEQVLITSNVDKKTKSRLLVVPIVLLVLAVIIFLGLTAPPGCTHYRTTSYYWYGRLIERTYTSHCANGYEAAFLSAGGPFPGEEHPGCFAFFAIACALLIFAVIGFIRYAKHKNCQLVITNNHLKGQAVNGKDVVLPLNMISGYSVAERLSSLTVETASGKTRFTLIENYYQIGKVLSEKIGAKQEKAAQTNSTADELVQLKNLLDAGIITQAEFDAKKQQLLGL